jgi:hypothetical protein
MAALLKEELHARDNIQRLNQAPPAETTYKALLPMLQTMARAECSQPAIMATAKGCWAAHCVYVQARLHCGLAVLQLQGS